MPLPLAIQSWCFRHFKDLPSFFAQLKSSGVSATEVCGVHANFTDPATFEPTVAAYKAAGVQIVAIGVERMTGNPALDRPRFEFCKAAGVRHMSITFAPDVFLDGKLKHVEALADEYDLRLGIHNHGGYDWLGNAEILSQVFARTSPRIGLHMDTAWAIQAAQNPVKWAQQFAPRLCGIHIKDFVFDRAGKETDVVIGTGNLDLPALMAALKAGHFDGPIVVEYEGDETAPAPALSECVRILQKLQ